MSTRIRFAALVVLFASLTASAARAEVFELITGLDARLAPGLPRWVVTPGPGYPPFVDGDRLAGTSDTGGTVAYNGTGTPMFLPNQFGSLSFTYRRGSIPFGPSTRVPLMGIDFLGGSRLDLDGDLGNGSRSLIPVLTGGQPATPVVMPGLGSYLDLTLTPDIGEVTINRFDVTGTNEGGPGIGPEIATTLTVLAGTSTHGDPGSAINGGIDSRTGVLLAPDIGIPAYRIDDLGFELWQDTLSATSSTAAQLGTLQFLGTFSGWYMPRDGNTGRFPTYAGNGLGSTIWSRVDESQIGQSFNTAIAAFGPTVTIAGGIPGRDDFTLNATETPTGQPNGGLPLSDFGGDIGGYFDGVVVPALPCKTRAFVYLESAGFGINNSGDPVFIDSVGYDVVIVAATPPSTLAADYDGSGAVDLLDYLNFSQCLSGPGSALPAPCCGVFDLDSDADVDMADFKGLQTAFGAE